MIDAYASLPHYWRHLAPILAALPPEQRGEVWADHGSRPWGPQLFRGDLTARTTLVASWDDALRLSTLSPRRRLVYVEHGAGQVYLDRPEHPAFSGGAREHRLANIVGYLVPGEPVAARVRAARPDAWVAAVGCPALDRHHGRFPLDQRTIAVTFHWPNVLCPESMWALPAWQGRLGDVIAMWQTRGFSVIGHAHPKAAGYMRPVWRRLRIEFVEDVDRVFQRANWLVADNTSLMYEWAAVGRPVVALASPLWRTRVHHGLRFWSHVPGPEYRPAQAHELAQIDFGGLAYHPEWVTVRERCAAFVYAPGSAGIAAQLAVAALLKEEVPDDTQGHSPG